MKTRLLATLAAVGIAATIATLSVTPASAASDPPRPLASGSSLFGLSCDDSFDGMQLFSLDTTTAIATPIGDGSNEDDQNCALQAAWDAANSTAYVANYSYTDDPAALYTVDPATGALTRIGAFHGGDVWVDAIAIDAGGAAYAISNGSLYSLNLQTAELTYIADLTEGGDYIYGFAASPTTGVFYTIDQSGVISTLDVTTGDLTELGQADLDGDTIPYSIQVDTNGTLWVENEPSHDPSVLWSIDPSDVANSAIVSGQITSGGDQYYVDSLLLIPGYAPVITSAAPTVSIVSGTPVTFTVTASGGAPITFAVGSGALPTGLVLDPATGVISGIPTVSGTFTFTVTASNTGGSTSATYSQTVTAAIHLPVVSG